MKRTSFALFVFACISFFSVQIASAVVPAPIPPRAPETRVITGTVESVSLGDPVNGEMSTIVIVNEKGQKVSLEIKAETTIYNNEGEKIALAKIKKGDEVTVEYVETKEIIEKAVSIKLRE